MDQEGTSKKKSHRDRNSGRKAEKKKNKKEKDIEELTDKQRNPKAFTFNSAIRAERRFRRKQDIDTHKQHVPVVDRSPIEPPPILIAVVGPPKVGKTTLINNLIKLFTKTPLTAIKGPVTIVTGKKRRITLIECNNDINSMIDLAKVCDLALLLCDASFGFEMEVFEFLNICQVHGMPRIMGILTHLDMIKNSKTLKNTKKTLKHRFWTEVYPGAKLFYLSGIIHGQYLNNEIKNLGRFISVMKFRPLVWRQNHSYILGDRYEDLTNQEFIRQNPKCDRTISLYGYVRGVPIKKENSIHVAGFGDLRINNISYLPDPCPLPEELKKRALIEKEKFIYAPFSGLGGIVYDKDAVYIECNNAQAKKYDPNDDYNILDNLFNSKETTGLNIQQDEVQLFTGTQMLVNKDTGVQSLENNKTDNVIEQETDNSTSFSSKNDNIKNYKEEQVVENDRIRRKVIFDTEVDENDDLESEDSESENEMLEDTNKTLDLDDLKVKPIQKAKVEDEIFLKVKEFVTELEANDIPSSNDSTNKLPINTTSITNSDVETDEEDSSNSETPYSEDQSSEDENFENVDVMWKENLVKKAQDAFLQRTHSTQNLMKQIYGVFEPSYQKGLKETEQEELSENENQTDIGGLFRKASKHQEKLKSDRDRQNLMESSLMFSWDTKTKDWTDKQNKPLIANCFVTGKWNESSDAAELLKLDDAENLSDIDSDMYGDFEDLETGVKHVSSENKKKVVSETGKKRKRENADKDEMADREALAEKKRKLKEKFDAEYDNTDKNTYYEDLKSTAEKQAQINKTVFENMPDEVRVEVEGFRPGMYVRIEIEKVPSEFITNFDPTYPLVIGSLNMGEENIGYVNVKIKKHRWYNKILKTGDPLIVSLGWRRFQTLPVYSKLEDDLKYRYLKYTPEHLACNAHFWGPITPQGTGFLALQSIDSNPETLQKQGFRIAATGAVQELDKSTQIMKKLKLIGYPFKIYKKTAFIKNMFTSALEVAKFEGARIKTVSGVRGQIKKAVSKPEGCFRATFEDKILLSGKVKVYKLQNGSI
ncbi:hypothetical protein ABEB36_008462 [Hypothenemus hampei]|uniref:Bms1-type G domain-containing protein n=1 Tax=Hypothenemus hampei TaxID=57062 RepID=A0ABD1ELY8_HYPHA